jgi:hypothetical protein
MPLVLLTTLVGGGATPRSLGSRDGRVLASLLNLATGDGDGFHTIIESPLDFSIDWSVQSVGHDVSARYATVERHIELDFFHILISVIHIFGNFRSDEIHEFQGVSELSFRSQILNVRIKWLRILIEYNESKVAVE